jgi:hypothetical protein
MKNRMSLRMFIETLLSEGLLSPDASDSATPEGGTLLSEIPQSDRETIWREGAARDIEII